MCPPVRPVAGRSPRLQRGNVRSLTPRLGALARPGPRPFRGGGAQGQSVGIRSIRIAERPGDAGTLPSGAAPLDDRRLEPQEGRRGAAFGLGLGPDDAGIVALDRLFAGRKTEPRVDGMGRGTLNRVRGLR